MGGQRHVPAALSPSKTRYPLCRRLDGPQGQLSVICHRMESVINYMARTGVCKVCNVQDWPTVNANKRQKPVPVNSTVIPRLTGDPANEFFG